MQSKHESNALSNVESAFIATSQSDLLCSPTVKMPVLVAESFPQLGRLTALRFLEWVQSNPTGVVSLPTGKTPEHFIAQVRYFLDGWDTSAVAEQLSQVGLDPAIKPDLSRLHFVQIDEFYPIESLQANSFFFTSIDTTSKGLAWTGRIAC